MSTIPTIRTHKPLAGAALRQAQRLTAAWRQIDSASRPGGIHARVLCIRSMMLDAGFTLDATMAAIERHDAAIVANPMAFRWALTLDGKVYSRGPNRRAA